MPATIPFVEVADHRDAPRIGRPDGEMGTVDALELHFVGAQLVEQPQMAALADIVIVHRPQHRTEGIGVEHRPGTSGVLRLVADRLALIDLDPGLKEAGGMAGNHVPKRRAVERKGIERIGMGHEGPEDPVSIDLMQAEKGKGIAVATRHDGLDFPRLCLPVFLAHAHTQTPPRVSRAISTGLNSTAPALILVSGVRALHRAR